MSTEKVELSTGDNNPSLEEQANTTQNNTVDTDDTRVSVSETNTTEDTRPEWLPEKFKSAEDLAKAYSELEKKQSTPEPIQPQEPEDKTYENETTPNAMDKFYNEYAQEGELSEKSYNELESMGLSKDLVDGYIAGQMAIADNDVATIHNLVGGKDNYSKVIEFASQNLSEAEKDAFNSTLDNGSIEQVKFAVQAIASRAGINAEQPQQMINGDSVETSSDVFESVAQVTEAMNDRRYETDPAYRKKVAEKIARSTQI